MIINFHCFITFFHPFCLRVDFFFWQLWVKMRFFTAKHFFFFCLELLSYLQQLLYSSISSIPTIIIIIYTNVNSFISSFLLLTRSLPRRVFSQQMLRLWLHIFLSDIDGSFLKEYKRRKRKIVTKMWFSFFFLMISLLVVLWIGASWMGSHLKCHGLLTLYTCLYYFQRGCLMLFWKCV